METPMTYGEMFGIVEKVVEKPVKVQQRPFEEAVTEFAEGAGQRCEGDTSK